MRGAVALLAALALAPPLRARGAVRPAVALLAALALALAGCGGDGNERAAGNENGDPATIAPARTLFYATAYLRPRGVLKASVDPFLARVLARAQPDVPLPSWSTGCSHGRTRGFASGRTSDRGSEGGLR